MKIFVEKLRGIRFFTIAYLVQKALSILFTIFLINFGRSHADLDELKILFLLPSVLGFLTIFDFGFTNFIHAHKNKSEIKEVYTSGILSATIFTAAALCIYSWMTYQGLYLLSLSILLNILNYILATFVGFSLKNEQITNYVLGVIGQFLIPMIGLSLVYLDSPIQVALLFVIFAQLSVITLAVVRTNITLSSYMAWIKKFKTPYYSLLQLCTFAFTGADVFILIHFFPEIEQNILEYFRVIAIMLALPNFINLFDTVKSDKYRPAVLNKIIVSIFFAYLISKITFFTLPFDYFMYAAFLVVASYMQTDFMIMNIHKITKILPIFCLVVLVKIIMIESFGIMGVLMPGILMLFVFFLISIRGRLI